MSQPSRLEKKAENCLEKGEFYEAHQVYRTMYFRMLQQEKFEELLDLLCCGCKKLAAVKEALGSIDLAELYAETLVKSKKEPSEGILEQISSMVELFTDPSFVLPTPDAHNRFISSCVKWSQSVATKRREKRHGLSELHYVIAKAYIAHGQYVPARNHMLFAEHPEEFATLLRKICEEGGCKSLESELFCVLPALQLLAMHRVQTASRLLAAYTANDDTPNGFRQELLNFLRLVCNALTLHDVNLFDHLVKVYKPHLDADPNYSNYIDRIGHIFFGHPSQKRGDSLGGLFGNILKGVLGEKKEEDEIFSDSDFETGVARTTRSETEDAYETAEESDIADVPQSGGQKQQTVENFDDLD
ncbi:hypothetical protein RB195_017178 [Necator americanus]|uniref:Golgi to ER traffic protein 4 homolog n=1 Tax=Necator americanus TaxID=51031 RepID=A0ABR1C7P1_NECAM